MKIENADEKHTGDRLVSATQAAATIGIARGTIYNALWRGKLALEVVRLNRTLRFRESEIQAVVRGERALMK